MITTWVLVVWMNVTPPGEPVVLLTQNYKTEADCKAGGKVAEARLAKQYVWFCIQLVEPVGRRREAQPN